MARMSTPSQTPAEKAALHAAWTATNQVAALATALRTRALTTRASFDAEGLTGLLQFAIAWQAEHGALPESGILCD